MFFYVLKNVLIIVREKKRVATEESRRPVMSSSPSPSPTPDARAGPVDSPKPMDTTAIIDSPPAEPVKDVPDPTVNKEEIIVDNLLLQIKQLYALKSRFAELEATLTRSRRTTPLEHFDLKQVEKESQILWSAHQRPSGKDTEHW
ncbi:uncharacterized protein LOC118197385 [Stegodyphus dumicola]|uniref:uncharacterized protein LOC118197385 n=1 Tax=Stegodyphus dumicola TaxID=202533 RepID=UPI0015B076BC|nr:uncharacterized protein LOC118197385 [Stegodyphus dumicola]